MTDMKNFLQDEQNTEDIKPANLFSHDSQKVPPNNATDTPVPDSGSISVSSNDNRKVSREDIELVGILYLYAFSYSLLFS